ncbi:MAG: hypothetical protein OEY36_11640 [Gammaproteobacteria bacterium]|nr:hypothetical protein [Gammaproteobacteria bacterium]
MKKNTICTSPSRLTDVPATPAENTTPPSINGYSLSMQQLNHSLSSIADSTKPNTFDTAIGKQQQNLLISECLEKQTLPRKKINHLLNDNAAVLINSRLCKFKLHCPDQVLPQLVHTSTSNIAAIKYSHIISQNFYSLVNELLYSLLNSVLKVSPDPLHDQTRGEWRYELSPQFNQIKSAHRFLNIKTFDKLCRLAKDKEIQEQLGRIKHLFQHNVFYFMMLNRMTNRIKALLKSSVKFRHQTATQH